MKTHHVLVLSFTTDKPIPEMTDLIAGRVYSMDNISKPHDVTCSTFAEYVHQLNEKTRKSLPAASNAMPLYQQNSGLSGIGLPVYNPLNLPPFNALNASGFPLTGPFTHGDGTIADHQQTSQFKG